MLRLILPLLMAVFLASCGTGMQSVEYTYPEAATAGYALKVSAWWQADPLDAGVSLVTPVAEANLQCTVVVEGSSGTPLDSFQHYLKVEAIQIAYDDPADPEASKLVAAKVVILRFLYCEGMVDAPVIKALINILTATEDGADSPSATGGSPGVSRWEAQTENEAALLARLERGESVVLDLGSVGVAVGPR